MARGGQRTRSKVVYFTDDELAAVEAAAAASSRTPGRFIREAALGVKIRARRGAGADAVAHQLARIGNNLNQLAHAANASGRMDTEAELRALAAEIGAKLREL